ncbi:VOC family protein [Candidatus Dojkabacteria bacterium]|uniref:VOC family protein n=1 Tax=Candidatus Dojkabacteria bacterium TaxID=2099670 RepID=A0A955I260_9BACT|nr:VOC family protein [Candidatus Dojkabacteria bacterium]
MNIDTTIFYTNSIKVIVNFYVERLGFQLKDRFGDKFASFQFDKGPILGIKQSSEPREVPGYQTVLLHIEDIEAKFEDCVRKGIRISKTITDETWGMEFSIFDPDGNKVVFVNRKIRN